MYSLFYFTSDSLTIINDVIIFNSPGGFRFKMQRYIANEKNRLLIVLKMYCIIKFLFGIANCVKTGNVVVIVM